MGNNEYMIQNETKLNSRKNCFRYLKLMSPLNGPDNKILFKKQLFDLEVKVS